MSKKDLREFNFPPMEPGFRYVFEMCNGWFVMVDMRYDIWNVDVLNSTGECVQRVPVPNKVLKGISRYDDND